MSLNWCGIRYGVCVNLRRHVGRHTERATHKLGVLFQRQTVLGDARSMLANGRRCRWFYIAIIDLSTLFPLKIPMTNNKEPNHDNDTTKFGIIIYKI